MDYPSNIEFVKALMQQHEDLPYWTIRKGKDTSISHKKGDGSIEGAIQALEQKLFLLTDGNYKITLYSKPNQTTGGVTTDLVIGAVQPFQNNSQNKMNLVNQSGGYVTTSEAQRMVELALEKKENEILRERVIKLETAVEKLTKSVDEIQKAIDLLTDDDEDNDIQGEELLESAGKKVEAATNFLEAMKGMKGIKF